ncbi:hypothetical protein [Hadaka virus 1]|nr:hypothetical protein [Hadaka virus 1]
MDLSSRFYQPGSSVVLVGSLMYHSVLNQMTYREISALDPLVTVRSFINFISMAPDGIRSNLFDESTTVNMQLAMQQLIDEEGGEEPAARLVMELAKSYYLEGVLDTAGPGHMSTGERMRELSRLVEGRVSSSPYFPRAVCLLFSTMRANTPYESVAGAVNAFNSLKKGQVVRELVFLGVQKEVAYWSGRVVFRHPITGQRNVFCTPYMPTQALVRAFVGVCLHAFYSDNLEIANASRVKRLIDRTEGFSFDRPQLRASINQANSILETCVLDRQKLKLVSVEEQGVSYSIRSASEGVALAFAFHFTGNGLEHPSTRLSRERLKVLLRQDLSPPIPSVPQSPQKSNRYSVEIIQHMRILGVTRDVRSRRGVDSLNHVVGYGIFSSSDRVAYKVRNAQRLRERLLDVIAHVRSRGLDPRTVFFHIEWNDFFDISMILTFMSQVKISGAVLIEGGRFILVRPMAIMSDRLTIQLTNPGVPETVKERAEFTQSNIQGLQFTDMALVVGGVTGVEETEAESDRKLVATKSSVCANSLLTIESLIESDVLAVGDVKMSYASVDLLFPDACEHLLLRAVGEDIPDTSCSRCLQRRRIMDMVDGLQQAGVFLEKPRYAYGHNSHFSLVFDDIMEANEDLYKSGELLAMTRDNIRCANAITCFRNTPGRNLCKFPGSTYHEDKEILMREVKERIYRLFTDPAELGPITSERLPLVALTEAPDTDSTLGS